MIYIKRILVKNFRSYGNNPTEVLFNDTNELITIIGSNGKGKSSLFSIAIHFALFGDSPKGKIEDLINWDTGKNLLVELDLYDASNNTKYTIRRGLKPAINELLVNDEKYESDNLLHKKDFNDTIIDLLKIDKVFFTKFINNNINESMDFLSAPRGEKMKIFNYLFNLDNIILLKEFLKKEQKTIISELNVEGSELKIINKEYEVNENNIESYKKDITDEENNLKILEKENKIFEKEKDSKILEYNNTLKECELNICNFQKLIEEHTKNINDLKNNINKLYNTEIEEKINDLKNKADDYNTQIMKMDSELATTIIRLSNDKKELKLLLDKRDLLKENPNVCPVCNNILDEEHYLKELQIYESNINKLNDSIEKYENNIKNHNTLYSELKKKLEKIIKEYDELKVLWDNNKKNIIELEDSLDKETDLLSKQKLILSEYNTTKTITENNITNILNKSDKTILIDSKKNDIKKMKNRLKKMILDNNIIGEKYNSIAEKIDKYNSKNDYLEFLINTVMDNSKIIKYIIDSNLKIIEKLVNIFLNRFQFPHTLKLEFTQDLELHFSNSKPFDVFSDGESMRVKFAFAFAFIFFLKGLSKNNLNLLVLDEMISSSADDEMIEETFKILNELKEEMSVIVITHDDRVKDRFDRIFKIEKGVFSNIGE
jgi:DNA repair exonuclease SbcCD ATPase subunit